MIKFHPSDNTLVSFVEGELSSHSSLLVSAHCDMCPTCRDKHDSLTHAIAAKEFVQHVTSNSITREYVCMFESITSDSTLVDPCTVVTKPHTIELEGKTFRLPATLARCADKIGGWTHLLGKLWYAPVQIGGSSVAHFVYMEKGSSVPEHSHKGNELTLVINGYFEDGNHTFQTGDYIECNQNHIHTPISNANEGCLVFTVLDKPLHFTSGWAKLINPLSHLYFKVNSKN